MLTSVLPQGRRNTQDTPPVSAPPHPLPVEDGYTSGHIPSPPLTPPPPLPPRAATSSHRLPARQPIPTFSAASTTSKQLSTSAPAVPDMHQRVLSAQPNGDIRVPPSQPPKYVNARVNAIASTSRTPLLPREDPKVSGFPGGPQSTGLMSPPSTQASESSIYSVVTRQYPEVGAALQQAAPKRKKSTKKYIERPHILAKEVSRIYYILRHSVDASASTKPGCRRRTRS